MPTLVGEIIIGSLTAAGVGAGAAEGISASAITLAGVTVSAQTVGTAAILTASIGLSYATQQTPKQPKPADGLLSIRQPNPVRQGGYGRMRCACSYMLYDISGTLVISIDVLAIISGQICGIHQIYLNEDAPARSGGMIISMSDGRYFGSSVNFDYRLGLPTEVAYAQVISSVITPGSWGTAFRGDGIASATMFCLQAPTIAAQPTYYPSGRPEPTFECDLYPLWDFRDVTQDPDDRETWIAYPVYDASVSYFAGDRRIVPSVSMATAYSGGTTYARYETASSGGVDYYSRVDGNIGNPVTDLTKWLPMGAPYYSRVDGNIGNDPVTNPDKWVSVLSNPVLQLVDYLTDSDHGMGLDRDILITPVVETLRLKAYACDALVLDKDGNEGPRYTSNGKFNFDDDPADVLGQIGATCDSWWCEDGDGALALEVGVYNEPTITLDFDRGHLLLGPFSINYGIADEQIVNELSLTFTDPTKNYKEVPGQPWRDETDISERGVTRSQPFSAKWVHRHSQARRLTKRAMARLTAPRGTLTTTLYGLVALGRRWVRVKYPFIPEMSDAVVELSRASIDFMNGRITFDWMLVDPDTIDAWDPVTEEGEGPADV